MGSSKLPTRLISLALCLALALTWLPAWAANVCDPVTGTNCVEVEAASAGGSAHVAPFDRQDQYHGVKPTYRAGTATAQSGVVVTAASAAPFFCIQGSATKTIVIQRLFISGGTLTAVAYVAYVVAKYSSAVSGGTATALTQTPMDANSGAATANLVNVYTAAPTAGSLVGTVSVKRTLLQATTAAAAGIPDVVEFDFRTLGSENSGVYLRGTAQGLCANFGAAPATAVTIALVVEWTEE